MQSVGVDFSKIRKLYEVECKSEDDLLDAEYEEISKYSPERLLNDKLSRVHSEETKKKISETQARHTPEEKKIIADRLAKSNTKRGCLAWNEEERRWRFSWCVKRKQTSKSFSVYKYKTKTKAHTAALKFKDDLFPLPLVPVIRPAGKGIEKLYRVSNTTNDKMYFGITKRLLYERMSNHRYRARMNSPNNTVFYRDMFNFSIELVRNLPGLSKSELLDEEAEEMKK